MLYQPILFWKQPKNKYGYAQKLISIFGRSSIIGLWPLNERGGIVAYDISGNNRHGVYNGCLLANTNGPKGEKAPLWDGINDYCNVYSVSLSAGFNINAGTLLVWGKVLNAGVWTDATNDFLLNFAADSTNYTRLIKASSANTITAGINFGGTAKSVGMATAGNINWFFAGLTWDKTADQMKAYYNGAQSGATQTALGTWSGTLSPIQCDVGAQTSSGATPCNGWEQYALLLNRAALQSEILSAYNII